MAGVAAIAGSYGDDMRAARMFGAASALRESAGGPLRPFDQDWHDRAVAVARDAAGEANFAVAWAAGAALPPLQAIAETLEWAALETKAAPTAAIPTTLGGLTPREMDVLRLLTEGKSDREIASVLFVSRRTASTHVATILHKLGVTSRAAAAAYAVRHGLA
jgi:DNA-binding NarL/FixJ family response regulator